MKINSTSKLIKKVGINLYEDYVLFNKIINIDSLEKA